MKLKANLHFHAQGDPNDSIDYTFFEGCDYAQSKGFQVLALTPHLQFGFREDYADYAKRRGMLFIPGIELAIEKRHVVVLNPEKSIEGIKTFSELKTYKEKRPEIFIIAPHPYFWGNFSLAERLGENINLFDAIELSWFYSNHVNKNILAEKIAKQRDIPYIAMGDTHELYTLEKNYAIIDAKEKTIPAVFDAIRAGAFQNITTPQRLFRDMVRYITTREIKNLLRSLGFRK